MNQVVETITLTDLALALGLVIPVLLLHVRWELDGRHLLYAVVRMLVQLLLIGYVLAFIFAAQSAWVVLLVLAVMLCASGWIALDNTGQQRIVLLRHAVLAILLGGGVTLAVVTQWVLDLDPWYRTQYMVPLAGMIFANAMNTVSLCAERMGAEIGRNEPFTAARNTAYRAGMIPVVNMMMAVGIVSLPGMMTGQILSGVSPLIAARYQIVVMCMVLSSAGLSAALFLTLARRHYQTGQA